LFVKEKVSFVFGDSIHNWRSS